MMTSKVGGSMQVWFSSGSACLWPPFALCTLSGSKASSTMTKSTLPSPPSPLQPLFLRHAASTLLCGRCGPSSLHLFSSHSSWALSCSSLCWDEPGRFVFQLQNHPALFFLFFIFISLHFFHQLYTTKIFPTSLHWTCHQQTGCCYYTPYFCTGQCRKVHTSIFSMWI